MSTLLLESRVAIIHHWVRGLCTANEANRLLAESSREAKALEAEVNRLEVAAYRGLERPLSDLEMQHRAGEVVFEAADFLQGVSHEQQFVGI